MPASTPNVTASSGHRAPAASDKSIFSIVGSRARTNLELKPRPADADVKPKQDKFKNELSRATESQRPKQAKDRADDDDRDARAEKPVNADVKKPSKATAIKKSDRAGKAGKSDDADDVTADDATTDDAPTGAAADDVATDQTSAATDDDSDESPDDSTDDATAADGTKQPAKGAPLTDAELAAAASAAASGKAIAPVKEPEEAAADQEEDGSEDAVAEIGPRPQAVAKKALAKGGRSTAEIEDASDITDGDESADGEPDAAASGDALDEAASAGAAQGSAKGVKKAAGGAATPVKSESSTWGKALQSPAADGKGDAKAPAQRSNPADAASALNAVSAGSLDDVDPDADRDSSAGKAIDPSASAASLKAFEMFGADNAKQPTATTSAGPSQSAGAKLPPEQQFAADNHPQIVSNVRGVLLPTGGTMHIRLDPPELGQMQISVHVRGGVMSASFETTNDDATRMLSHSLSDLKGALEASGIAVDKLHVQQSSKGDQATDKKDDGRQQGQQTSDSSARREQERKELLRRMWDKLTNGRDPLDTVG